ncbi:membrane-associated phosphatidylinositol transfer protein 2-like isoform X2 [Corticium candelabrum]|uniref:membrane-associated phosphatidylinositol transfer protein 2-like isoform X2 n=1 Tax=Corticium candelabrum TaxID=121492 RepID=UPI002E271385|nr:membrane-associated phosphatidylinositol transfer protein 2-like isoform X2 [Corticium candelabrum]
MYILKKKSREESNSSESRVEILVNEPYVNGPGGTNGQYTHKIYHVGSHLPMWLRAFLPKSALRVEEKAWNAYPYTKTRFTCPFLEKFSIEVETYYYQDAGTQNNVFDMSRDDLRQRPLEFINITDDLPSSHYKREEDPLYFVSKKSGRGPLSAKWLEEQHDQVMCSYKLCKVEFRYWGMQSRVERFIDDIALRRTMLQAHRQAWCWQDEWLGLEMADIRRLERETQTALQGLEEVEAEEAVSCEVKTNVTTDSQPPANIDNHQVSDVLDRRSGSIKSQQSGRRKRRKSSLLLAENLQATNSTDVRDHNTSLPRALIIRRESSRQGSPLKGTGHQAAEESLEAEMALIRMDAIEMGSTSGSDSDSDVYYDAQEEVSEELQALSLPSSISTEWRAANKRSKQFGSSEDIHSSSDELEDTVDPLISTLTSGKSSVDTLVLVFHGGSIIETNSDRFAKNVDCQTLQQTFHQIVNKHYQFSKGRIAFRLVACPPICKSAVELMSSVSPIQASSGVAATRLPLELMSIFAVSQPEYQEIVGDVVVTANDVFEEFLQSEEGQNFVGHVCIIGDCMGGVLAYDALCNRNLLFSDARSSSPSPICSVISRSSSCSSLGPSASPQPGKATDLSYLEGPMKASVSSNYQSVSPVRKRLKADINSCPGLEQSTKQLEVGSGVISQGDGALSLVFEVSDLFVLGCPLGHVIAHRQLSQPTAGHPFRPHCSSVYNLFHTWDPVACRVEPLLDNRFSSLSPVSVPQYDIFPLGDESLHKISNTIHSHPEIFACHDANLMSAAVPSVQVDVVASHTHKPSERSSHSLESKDQPLSSVSVFGDIGDVMVWWSDERLDYVVYCPEVVESFPRMTVPTWMHVSYWESRDVAAFIVRQILQHNYVSDTEPTSVTHSDVPFVPVQPREHWNHKRAGYKIGGLSAYHRGYDVAVLESQPQIVSARFSYGLLDLVSLIDETIDVFVLSPSVDDWAHVGSSNTDKKGRFQFTVPQDRQLPCGIHEVKMLVRGDHTVANCSLLVLQPAVEAVVFSIDGSFANSMSIRGRNPKLRSGAVEVVRLWQELGYLIIYVTGRPDMQKQNVMMWLAHKNFPYGIVFFCDGLARDPQRHKAAFLQSLQDEAKVKICSAYGSKKDIKLYQEVGLKPTQIKIVAKSKMGMRKALKQDQVQVVEDYGKHLEYLQAHSCPSSSPRIPVRKTSFLPLKVCSSKKYKKPQVSSRTHQKGATSLVSSKAPQRMSETTV